MKQNTALDILKAGKNVYLTGAAGSGKTHILNEYINYLKYRGVAVSVTASTGIAATHLSGVTIHSWSGIGIKNTLSDYEIEALEQKEYLWKRFEKTKVLIIDEVSMLSPLLFDTIERVCRVMKRKDKPFGGMQVILSGDFFQLPPIVRGKSKIEFINKSNAWSNMNIHVCYLHEQFRQKDNELENILNEMRTGRVSDKSRDILMNQSDKKKIGGIIPTQLYTHNVDVDTQNNKELERLPGKEKTFLMESKGKSAVVIALKKSVLSPEKLCLKKDAIVMFVKNSFDNGYANGTLGIVEGFDNYTPIVKTFSGNKIYVHSAEWTVEENSKIVAKIEQLPLRLAWAITVHKSQGMSLDAAEIDLSKSFVPGQGYVAISRLRTMKGLYLRGINNMAFIVHPEVLDLDKHLLFESKKWEKVIARFDDKEINDMHAIFIKKSGGTLNKKEIEKNKHRKSSNLPEKIPTHEQTRKLLKESSSLKDIAEKRGMTLGTIITHLEKLKLLDKNINLEKLKPKVSDLKKIIEAFKKTGDTKLAPVHSRLKGKYSYEEIRIARLFL